MSESSKRTCCDSREGHPHAADCTPARRAQHFAQIKQVADDCRRREEEDRRARTKHQH